MLTPRFRQPYGNFTPNFNGLINGTVIKPWPPGDYSNLTSDQYFAGLNFLGQGPGPNGPSEGDSAVHATGRLPKLPGKHSLGQSTVPAGRSMLECLRSRHADRAHTCQSGDCKSGWLSHRPTTWAISVVRDIH